MASVPRATRRHYRAQQVLTASAMAEAVSAWRAMSASFDASWTARVLPRLLRVLTIAQREAATSAAGYVADVLGELGIDAPPAGELLPETFVGSASDGRPLDSLLYGPVARAKQAREGGQASVRQALGAGEKRLKLIVQGEIADAERVATETVIASRAAVGGYVRMLNPPSCARCVVLAGKWYRWNAGFERHPGCFPAGVTVSGPSTEAASRRWYEGELVIIRTASGQELPATGNHPVLTDRGWVPAHLLQEGDHVIRGTRSHGAAPLVVPDKHQMPARIEDVWSAGGVVTLSQMPTTSEDFHGDGGHGHVDVVLRDGFLRDGAYAAPTQLSQQEQLAVGVAPAAEFAPLGAGDQGVERLLGATHGSMRGGGLGPSFRASHAVSSRLACGGHAADLDAPLAEAFSDDPTGNTVAQAQRVLALTRQVRRRDLDVRQGEMSPRWDAPAPAFSVENRGAYASRGQELRERLSGQIAADCVVELRRVRWSGHVYNLTSAEGWYSANGLIVSNCDCRHIPAREDNADEILTDPRKYFDSLSREEQNETFTPAGAEAIRHGADISQVVNARRGMSTTVLHGRDAKVTTEGITRRGVYGGSQGAAVSGYAQTRVGRRGYIRNSVERRARRARLMPETILANAENRDDAVRLLKLYGFIT